jgi:WXG100 family type VII secretion target
MAGQIRMTPEQMRQRSKEFKTEGQKVEEVNKKMLSLIGILKSEWEGQAAQKFEDQYNQLRPAFDKTRQLIDDISTQLAQTATAVEDMDREIASKFGV